MMRFFFIFFFLGTSIISSAQQFGGFPSSTKWKQINTDTARVIFTGKATQQARQVATILHQMAADQNPLGSSLNKINVVLHNNTTLANGYVGLAPFRSEYYLVPGGNIFEFGNLPWHEQLAVHEYRHVQQYNNFNRGLSKGFGILFGQEGRALANALSVPDWFFEGDAVYAETILTPQGRGRMPYFLNGFNSLWKEGRDYNWMKLRNGSLKDYVPNHYQLGYLLVNYGYEKYGPGFWQKVTRDASAFRGLFYPFQKAVKQHAGLDFKSFRQDALKQYSHEVSKRRDRQRTRATVSNIYFPQVIGEDSLLYVKDSYRNIPAFYIKTKGDEHKIKLRNITTEDWFSYRKGMVAYTSYNANARWSLIDYSDIILLDIKTGSEEKITSKGKYFSPDISPDGNSIVSLFVTDSVKSELHLLDRNGKVLNKINAPEQSFFVHPKFISDQTIVAAIRWPNATMSMETLDLESGKREQLLPPGKATLGLPFVYNGSVYFVSSLSGNDDLYQLRLKDKKLYQLTTGQTGNYFPSVYDDQITWSAFSSNGYQLQQKKINELVPVEINPMQASEQMSMFKVANEEKSYNLLASPVRNFTIDKYRKSTGLFNFHSWRPDYEDPEFSFSVYSNNILNTFSNELFYRYNQNEESHAVGLNTSYAGLFPVIRAGIEYTYNRHVKTPSNTFTLDQSEVRLGYYIPLSFTKGKTYKFLNFGTDLVYNNLKPTGASKNLIPSQHTTYFSHFLNWNQLLPRARKQIYPRFGYALYQNYRHRINEKGYQTLSNAQLYLPSLFKTHNLVMTGSFQQTDTNNVIFSNRFANSRGYEDYYFSRMWRASANYHFPLLYPDRGVANIVYLLRIRSNVFYDFTKVYSKNKQTTRDLRSVGTEILFDTRWWNQLPVSLGLRYSYLLDPEISGKANRNVFEFIIPIDLISN
jgi:hypothetical protein